MHPAIPHLTQADPVLARIIQRVGEYQIRFREPEFETLVRSIVYQQLSGRVAAVILERLIRAAGGRLTPENILKLRPSRMRALALSTQKTAYIRDLARQTQVKGIGQWTAHMFLMFALRRPDILPTGDLGLRNAIRQAYALETLPTPDAIERMAAAWRPHCTAATWYLWRSLEPDANL